MPHPMTSLNRQSFLLPLFLFVASVTILSGCNTKSTKSTSTPNPVPTISSLSPSSATAGAAAQTLTIAGTNFMSGSTATYNGAAHTVTYVSATQITIPLTASDQAMGGTFAVVVTNPTPGGGASNSMNFTVNNSTPAITSLAPTTLPAGSAAQTLTINGTGFVSTSTATYNGIAHTVTFVSVTQLTIPLTTADLATAGSYPVVVTNPAPGGGASGSVAFVVGSATGPAVVGTVYKGLESGATVNVFAVNADGTSGANLGVTSATTDSSGSFSITLTAAPTGAIRITATGGTYTSESDGTTVTGTSAISALIDSVPSGGISGIVITPISEFINSYAAGLMKSAGDTEAVAHASSTTLLDAFYGLTAGTTPETLMPKFAKTDITGSPDAFKLGYAISTLALEGHSLIPTSPDDLIAELSLDISDGVWDGKAFGTVVPAPALRRATLRGPSPEATVLTTLPPSAGTSDWEVNLSLCATSCTSVTGAGIGVVDLSALLASMSGGASACACTPAAVGLNANSSGAIATLAYTPTGLSGTHQYVFLAARTGGVVIVDVTDPTVASPFTNKWPSIATALGSDVGGVIPVIIPGLGHPSLFVFAYGTKNFALLNIDKLISGTDPDPTVFDFPVGGTPAVPLPIVATSPVNFSGGSAYVSGGIPAGGTILLSTADGYEALTESSITSAGLAFTSSYPIDPSQFLAENMGADIVHGQILGGNYQGIQLIDLIQGKSFYMPGSASTGSTNAVTTYFPDFSSGGLIDGNSVDTTYRVGILTSEDTSVAGFINLATITETPSTGAGVLNSFAPASGGTFEVKLSTVGAVTISGSAVDPGTHLALFMAGFSNDLAVGLVQDPTLATPCPSTAVTTWQGLCDWRFYTINNSPSLSAYSYAQDPHAVGVVVNEGLGNSKAAGRAYGYLLDGSSLPVGVVQIDLGAFLTLPTTGTTGDLAHQPSGDPAVATSSATGAVVMKEFKF